DEHGLGAGDHHRVDVGDLAGPGRDDLGDHPRVGGDRVGLTDVCGCGHGVTSLVVVAVVVAVAGIDVELGPHRVDVADAAVLDDPAVAHAVEVHDGEVDLVARRADAHQGAGVTA